MKAVAAPRGDMPTTVSDEYTAFYHEHFPRLAGSLAFYTGDRELAMDLAQEALARAYRDWRKVSGLDAPAAWLHRVAFNLANSAFRRRFVERRSWSAGSPDHHHDADAGDAVAIRKAIATLPTRQKTALVLRYYADMSVADAAQAMGCAEGTVRALTSQALATLRRCGLIADAEGEA